MLYSTKVTRIALLSGPHCQLTPAAHIIRNPSSRTAKAVSDISVTSRWAVTGTPIQNRLADLAALLKFLRIDPYSEAHQFDADIVQLWKTGEAEEAVKRLKRLASCILLRRPKATINLPRRKDLMCPVEFNTDERALYDELRNQVAGEFRDRSENGMHVSNSTTFVNVIQQINTLRMICSMGIHYKVRHEGGERNDWGEHQSWREHAQQAFDFQCESGPVSCHICSASLDLIDSVASEPQNPPRHQFAQCLRLICSDCTQSTKAAISCGHSNAHPLAHVSSSRASMERPQFDETLLSMRPSTVTSSDLPSKVTSLVTHLKSNQDDVKS